MVKFSPARIFHELRRRRVINSVAFYVVGAWLALQVAELALPALEIPDVAIRYVWIGAFLLFPLSLIFGWRYNITTKGIERTPPAEADADADTSLHRLDHAVIGSLSTVALAVIGAMLVRIGQVESEPAITTVENSIAVLPFTVCEDRIRERNLASSLTLEVINRLAERGKLKVIARASSLAFSGFGLSAQQIAKPLGVQYVLAGELCRDVGNLTLAAELFDDRGFIVWSDRFAQEVNPSEQVTLRVATLVANGIAAELGDVAPMEPEAPVNALAYEQLLIGRQYWENGDSERARAAFDRALQLEPNYVEALFFQVQLDTVPYLSKGREESIMQSRPRVEKVLRMARLQLEQDDRSAYNHYMVARLTRTLTDWDEELAFRWRHAAGLDTEEVDELRKQIKSGFAESERHFRAAIAFNPSLTNAYSWLADVIEKQGMERRTEALQILEDGQVRDPFNLDYNSVVAKRWAGRGRFRQAIELLDRFKELPEIPSQAWWWELEIMQVQDRWDEKAETLVDMLRNHPEAFDDWGNRWQIWWFVSSLANLGLSEEAEAWKVRLETMPMDDWMHDGGLQNYLIATGRNIASAEEGSWHWLLEQGKFEQAIEMLETSRYERKLWQEREVRDDMVLISLYQATGRTGEADELLASTVSYLETEYSIGIRQPETLYHLSEAYARQGRDDEAIDMLRKAYDYNWLAPCSELEYDAPESVWLRFRNDSRYRSLCERIEEDRAQQAEHIRAVLARYDVDELLAPLMALAPLASEMR